jgi:hypothetical protein
MQVESNRRAVPPVNRAMLRIVYHATSRAALRNPIDPRDPYADLRDYHMLLEGGQYQLGSAHSTLNI